MNPALLRRTQQLLAAQGYTTQELNGSFDLLARKGGQLLVLKLLADANALTPEHANEMRNFAAAISAAPLVIADRAGGKLDEGVVALRHDLFTLNLPTFTSAILSQQLFFLRNAAGITAQVAGDRLRHAREHAGFSIGDLAHRLGVSRTMATQYESSSPITAPRAELLAELFGTSVLSTVPLFDAPQVPQTPWDSPVAQKYGELGFSVTATHKLPFDIVARQHEEIILTEIGDKFREGLSPLSRMLDADSLVIFDKRKPRDVPALQRDEFLEISRRELLDVLKAR